MNIVGLEYYAILMMVVKMKKLKRALIVISTIIYPLFVISDNTSNDFEAMSKGELNALIDNKIDNEI